MPSRPARAVVALLAAPCAALLLTACGSDEREPTVPDPPEQPAQAPGEACGAAPGPDVYRKIVDRPGAEECRDDGAGDRWRKIAHHPT